MTTFIMLGKYSQQAVKEMSPNRTEKAGNLIKKLEGKVKSIYATLGEHDVLFIVDFPTVQQAMKASIAIGKLTGISFSTSAAVPIEEFDKMISET